LPEPLSTATSSSNTQNTTRLIEGIDNVLNTELRFFSNARKRIDTCMNYTRPELAIALEQTNNAFLDAKGKSVVLRYITEITKDNMAYCKELMTMVDELRHLEGIKGNFMLSETEYLAPIILFEKGKIASQIIYSNQKEIVDQHQYMFDTLWNKSISAEQRIKEIEEGVEHTDTRVLKNKAEIFSYMKSTADNADEQSTCCSIGGMQLVYNYFFDEYKKIADRSRKRKSSKGVRWITSIDKDTVDLVKIFLDSGMQVKHLKNLIHVDFAVNNKNFNATIDKMEGGKLMESLLISNEPAYVSHYNSVFEELWKDGIDATERIKDIEAGLDLEHIEVIPSSTRAQDRYLDIVKLASEEILWIFPTTNAFIRQDKIGAIPLAIEAARERNVKVKILMPANNLIEQRVQQLKEYCHSYQIDVKYIERMSETKATILVIDRKASLVMELKDDTKSTFSDAIGLSTYSDSKAGVLSYLAIFENLWKQSDLYEQLKTHDKMQKEFINIAAHELRSPIQPILSLSEVVLNKTKDIEQAKLLEVINRNGKRLQRLTEDILDVTRIESHSLYVKKEKFKLNDVLTNAIDDMNANKVLLKAENSNNDNRAIKLLYFGQDVFVNADKGRISQVITNLLDNAVKFTIDREGTITVIVERKEKGKQELNNHAQQVIVSIKDPGRGIDPEIFPRLFTKFATKSETGGTGLGLYICKGIIEAHDGKIWAENNSDGKGAIFSFTLPIVNKI
jgi:two-component system, OmpR family, sensor histidine kinase VicK